MRSLNLDFDDDDFERMKTKKLESKMSWEKFVYEVIMNSNVYL